MYAAVGPRTIVEIDGVTTTLGAATSGFKWRLIAAVFSGASAGGNFKLTSNSVDLTGNVVMSANDPVVLPPSDGWIEGSDDKDLILVGSGALDGWCVVQKIRCNQSSGGYSTS
jgi:hypothetical protein